MSTRTTQRLIVFTALLLLAAACGGSDDSDNGAGGANTGGGDSEIVVGGDLDLPDYFPADFYVPDSVTIRSTTGAADSATMSLSGSYEGDPEAVLADMVNGLRDAGYEFLSDSEDVTVFIKDGVGRIRIRAREFLDQPTLTVDIDNWTNEQIAELRALFVEDIVTTGRATATYGSETISAEGECTLKGDNRWFFAEDVSITLQLDAAQPGGLYADITTAEGTVYTIDRNASSRTETSATGFSATGAMVEFNNEDVGTVDFTIEATCDV